MAKERKFTDENPGGIDDVEILPETGMRPAQRGKKPQPTNQPLPQLQRRLQRRGIDAQLLVETDFFTLEQLVEAMQSAPLPAGITNHLNFYDNHGLVPLMYTNAEDGPHLVMGIKAFQDKRVVEPDHVLMNIQDYVNSALQAVGIQRDHVRYFLLLDDEVAQLKPLLTDAEARRTFINAIDEETSAENIYHALITRAIKIRATDIHIEPEGSDENRVRFRVDGVLQQGRYALADAALLRLINKIKIESGLDIDERRRPQDGGISFSEGVVSQHPSYKGYSIRVSTMPTNHGVEKVELRVLEQGRREFKLATLGYNDAVHGQIRRVVHAPKGLMLVVGPTGSGKTTTLYSILMELNTPDVNIVTIEDPVEVNLPGINQSQVIPKIGWTFPNVLRTYLRQDPDIIFVGEMRDAETANVAMYASNTGHLVLSTMHTNDAVSALERLLELGIDRSVIQTNLKAVLSQRLVRKVCGYCTEEYDASNELNEALGSQIVTDPVMLHRGTGRKEGAVCRNCDGTGYFGRTVIPELWVLTDDVREMIYQGERSYQAFLKAAMASGMKPLIVQAMESAFDGTTTIGEICGSALEPDEFTRHRELVTRMVEEYQAR